MGYQGTYFVSNECVGCRSTEKDCDFLGRQDLADDLMGALLLGAKTDHSSLANIQVGQNSAGSYAKYGTKGGC